MKSIALFSLMSAASLSAQVITDNFESYTLNSSLDGQGIWSVVNSTGTQTITAVDTESAFSGNSQGAYINDQDSGGSFDVQLRGDISSTFATDSGIQIDYDFSTAQLNRNPTFFLLGASNTIGIHLAATTSGWRYHDGSGLVSLPGSPSAAVNTWYRISITTSELDGNSAQTFDLEITDYNGGSPTSIVSSTGLSFRNNLTEFTQVRFANNVGANVAGGRINLDNVSVSSLSTIPETSTSALICGLVAGGMLLGRRYLKKK